MGVGGVMEGDVERPKKGMLPQADPTRLGGVSETCVCVCVLGGGPGCQI